VTAGGYGKRVPMSQFRLQNRAGMGIVATKFRKAGDRLSALRIVNEGDELMMITNRGIIIRQAVDAISCQSRAASGVRLQRLDEDDEIVAATVIPVSNEEETALEETETELSGGTEVSDTTEAIDVAASSDPLEPTETLEFPADTIDGE